MSEDDEDAPFSIEAADNSGEVFNSPEWRAKWGVTTKEVADAMFDDEEPEGVS